jgi:hypothetical protein
MQSPYSVFNGNPVYFADNTGQSGEATINKQKRTITITSKLIYFGGAAETKLSKAMSDDISSQFNNANGRVTIEGIKYKVKFKIYYETVSVDDAKTMIASNTSARNNFIRVEDLPDLDSDGDLLVSSKMTLNGNSALFNMADDLSGTTPAHEKGHGYGLVHTVSGRSANEPSDIMTAKGTEGVHEDWALPETDIVDPSKRRVQQYEIKRLLKNIIFDENGKADIGRATNTYRNSNGDKEELPPQ